MSPKYYIDPNRKCRFSVDYVTPGEKGLAWAILLKAVEDGCNKEWLKRIIDFYGIDFDEELLERKPANKIKFNPSTSQMLDIHFKRVSGKVPLLSLKDGLHLRGIRLVATE